MPRGRTDGCMASPGLHHRAPFQRSRRSYLYLPADTKNGILLAKVCLFSSFGTILCGVYIERMLQRSILCNYLSSPTTPLPDGQDFRIQIADAPSVPSVVATGKPISLNLRRIPACCIPPFFYKSTGLTHLTCGCGGDMEGDERVRRARLRQPRWRCHPASKLYITRVIWNDGTSRSTGGGVGVHKHEGTGGASLLLPSLSHLLHPLPHVQFPFLPSVPYNYPPPPNLVPLPRYRRLHACNHATPQFVTRTITFWYRTFERNYLHISSRRAKHGTWTTSIGCVPRYFPPRQFPKSFLRSHQQRRDLHIF